MNEIVYNELQKIMNIIDPMFHKNFKRDSYRTGAHNLFLSYNSNGLKYYYYAKPCLRVCSCIPGETKSLYEFESERGLVVQKEGLRYKFENSFVYSGSGYVISQNLEYDIRTEDYDSSDGYFNLSFKYPHLSEVLLTCIAFFCVNQVPNDIQIEIDIHMLSSINEGLSMFKDKLYANAR